MLPKSVLSVCGPPASDPAKRIEPLLVLRSRVTASAPDTSMSPKSVCAFSPPRASCTVIFPLLVRRSYEAASTCFNVRPPKSLFTVSAPLAATCVSVTSPLLVWICVSPAVASSSLISPKSDCKSSLAPSAPDCCTSISPLDVLAVTPPFTS